MFPSRTNHHTPFLARRPLLIIVIILSIFFLWSRLASKQGLWISIDESPHLTQHLVLASTTNSNLSWLPPALSKTQWTPKIYTTDNPTADLTVPINKGNEAMVYLTYILDNYHNLPDIIYFHHDHASSWHQTFTPQFEFNNLNLLEVLEKGYVSPRCLPGCENVIELDEYMVSAHYLRADTSRDVGIATILREFNGVVPEKVAAPCCAQFLVSGEAVRRVSVEVWKGMRGWLVETELDSMAAGRLFEYSWHIFFGMEAVHCPEETQCLCDVFGNCGEYEDDISSS